MREITVKTGNRKTSVPKWLIRKAVKEVLGDRLSISARIEAKRKARKKAYAKKRKAAAKAVAKKTK